MLGSGATDPAGSLATPTPLLSSTLVATNAAQQQPLGTALQPEEQMQTPTPHPHQPPFFQMPLEFSTEQVFDFSSCQKAQQCLAQPSPAASHPPPSVDGTGCSTSTTSQPGP